MKHDHLSSVDLRELSEWMRNCRRERGIVGEKEELSGERGTVGVKWVLSEWKRNCRSEMWIVKVKEELS